MSILPDLFHGLSWHIQYYWKPGPPMDKNTTYRLSYWENPTVISEPFLPEDNLTYSDAPMSDETTHKMSYFGNWLVKPETPITPCDRQWLGRGPVEDVTTHRHDYSWKCVDRAEITKARDNLCCPYASLSDDTTYRSSYYNSSCCLLPCDSFRPISKYVKSDVPMEDCTTYKLSYWPNEIVPKEDISSWRKERYHPPLTPLDGCTTYKLSYWPHCEKRRGTIEPPKSDNLLNAGCCFNDDTTYRLSYFGCGAGDRPDPIYQSGNIVFSPCPLSRDTVNRLSFLGNWCVKPEMPITPCDRQMLGRGPMQDVTTQKHDFTWKPILPSTQHRPENELTFSSMPLESCTTNRLSYIPTDECRISTKSFAPVHKYQPSDVSMECETTMRLSYQPVELAVRDEKTWVNTYHPPVDPMEDSTTYNLSYIPPGVLVPLSSCSASCAPADACKVPSQQACPAS